MQSTECQFLSQLTFESTQFTNLDNSIHIADRIGELYVVDSYICICRFGILLRQMRNKILPLRPTMDAGSLYLTRNKNRTTRHQLNRTICFGLAYTIVWVIYVCYWNLHILFCFLALPYIASCKWLQNKLFHGLVNSIFSSPALPWRMINTMIPHSVIALIAITCQ